MKLIALLSLFIGFGIQAGTPELTTIPVDDIFAPKGFDSNDSSEIIVSGWLPNLCHKSPIIKAKVVGKTINIKVTALKYDPTNPFCPEMIVPFIRPVNLGLLDKGNYKIVVNAATEYEKQSKIFIAESVSNAVDDHIYANVHYVEKQNGSKHIKINGYNPSDCLVMKEVKFVSNGINTYSVLPIMDKVRDFCPMKMMPFSYNAIIPDELQTEKILLHVRGMDGNSVNTLVNLVD